MHLLNHLSLNIFVCFGKYSMSSAFIFILLSYQYCCFNIHSSLFNLLLKSSLFYIQFSSLDLEMHSDLQSRIDSRVVI